MIREWAVPPTNSQKFLDNCEDKFQCVGQLGTVHHSSVTELCDSTSIAFSQHMLLGSWCMKLHSEGCQLAWIVNASTDPVLFDYLSNRLFSRLVDVDRVTVQTANSKLFIPQLPDMVATWIGATRSWIANASTDSALFNHQTDWLAGLKTLVTLWYRLKACISTLFL